LVVGRNAIAAGVTVSVEIKTVGFIAL